MLLYLTGTQIQQKESNWDLEVYMEHIGFSDSGNLTSLQNSIRVLSTWNFMQYVYPSSYGPVRSRIGE